jgi:cytidylate kinase
VTVIAIDGPAGSGKSTVAAAISARTGLACLHTGAMYRAVALASLRCGVAPSDGVALGELAAKLQIEVGERVLLDGEDVTEELRSSEVASVVSAVSAHAGVRHHLVELQRAWVREHGGAVVEGRDMGTVVFPEAELKIYLTASPEVRALRRTREGAGEGEGAGGLEAAARSLESRDRVDSGRAVSPLAVAEDAHVVDSSGLDVDGVVEKVLALL